MPYQYYGGDLQGLNYGQENPYLIRQQQQEQQQQQMDPMQMFDMYQQFAGQGAGAAGAGASSGIGGGASAAPGIGGSGGLSIGGGGSVAGIGGSAGGAAGGAGAGGGGAGGASGMAAAGPWAALAIAIMANEDQARKAGRRKKGWAGKKQALTGEGFKEDMRYYGDKVGGIGGKVINAAGTLGSPVDTFKKIRDIF